MPNAKALLVTGALSALALAGCGSSKSASSGSTTLPASSGSAVTSAPSNESTSSTAGSTTSSTLCATGAVPAVSGASDLKKEPTIAPGSGSPPAKLTGKDLVAGTGTVAGPGSTVTVQYVGALWSGKVFDASWTDQGPATFQLSGVIPGFKDAIIGMKVGGRREIVIPPALGYGASGQPPTIPPNSTLVFVIDLLQVQ
jgi:FKBP-type peptidyl-prolyl cis-trans isomerase